jgi:septal ring factor EnvC (AmiA/AmiB activator)
MGQHINKRPAKPTTLERRLQTASKDLHQIMKDLQRDCKPYWKFSELEQELRDIAHEAGKLTVDLDRAVKDKQNVLARIKRLANKVNKKVLSLEGASEVL